jgi:hypothetical protein
MTAAPAPAFPGSRVLAGWWRQLTPYRPEELWVGHLALHRVEALVELTHPCRPDPFTLLVLRAVRLGHGREAGAAPADDALRQLDERLHLGPALLRQILQALRAEGLAAENGTGGWALTPLGEQAVERGEYPRRSRERRSFHFVQPRAPGPGAVPHFLNLNSHSDAPAPVDEPWEFDPAALEASVARAAEWKARYGFPGEVSSVLGPGAGTEVTSWEQVIVDRPERLLTVLARVAGAPDRLLGFAARQEGWALQAGAPAFAIAGRWDELFPEVNAGLPPEAWRRAWRAWCEPRSLPEAEATACALEPSRERLVIRAPARLVERLRAARSDAVKGEAWLLAGEGPLRRAARIELVEASGG